MTSSLLPKLAFSRTDDIRDKKHGISPNVGLVWDEKERKISRKIEKVRINDLLRFGNGKTTPRTARGCGIRH